MGHYRRAGGRLPARLPRDLRRHGHPPAARAAATASRTAERALGVVKAFSVDVSSGVQLKLDVEAASGIADSGDHEQDLTDLLREIGEVAQTTGAGALFLIDEMHNLDAPSLAAICIAFQSISRHGLPVAMGRGRAARPPGPPDVRKALCRPPLLLPRARPPPRRCCPGRADRTRRHPAASTTSRTPPGESCAKRPATPTSSRNTGSSCGITPITSADVEVVREIVTDSLARNFFGTRFQMATNAEQRYLAAVAHAGEAPYRNAEIAANSAPKTNAASPSTATR
jgi:hypothetical protein